MIGSQPNVLVCNLSRNPQDDFKTTFPPNYKYSSCSCEQKRKQKVQEKLRVINNS